MNKLIMTIGKCNLHKCIRSLYGPILKVNEGIPYVPEKITVGHSKYRMNRSIISGCETITYYLHFAENPIRFGQVVTQKYKFSYIKVCHETIPSKF